MRVRAYDLRARREIRLLAMAVFSASVAASAQAGVATIGGAADLARLRERAGLALVHVGLANGGRDSAAANAFRAAARQEKNRDIAFFAADAERMKPLLEALETDSTGLLAFIDGAPIKFACPVAMRDRALFFNATPTFDISTPSYAKTADEAFGDITGYISEDQCGQLLAYAASLTKPREGGSAKRRKALEIEGLDSGEKLKKFALGRGVRVVVVSHGYRGSVAGRTEDAAPGIHKCYAYYHKASDRSIRLGANRYVKESLTNLVKAVEKDDGFSETRIGILGLNHASILYTREGERTEINRALQIVTPVGTPTLMAFVDGKPLHFQMSDFVAAEDRYGGMNVFVLGVRLGDEETSAEKRGATAKGFNGRVVLAATVGGRFVGRIRVPYTPELAGGLRKGISTFDARQLDALIAGLRTVAKEHARGTQKQ